MIKSLFKNKIFLATSLSAIIAQMIKTGIDWYTLQHFHWQSLFRGAGMPSSHTAGVVALVIAVYLTEGLTTVFVVTLVFSGIVIRDVIGDRIFAIQQENSINRIIGRLTSGEHVEWDNLIGHSALEVVAGVAVGILVTFLVFQGAKLIKRRQNQNTQNV